MQNKKLIDYEMDIVCFPVHISEEIMDLFKILGYSQTSLSMENGNITYKLVQNYGNHNLVRLKVMRGRAEFYYTSRQEKKQIKDILLEVEQNIESLLRMDGE